MIRKYKDNVYEEYIGDYSYIYLTTNEEWVNKGDWYVDVINNKVELCMDASVADYVNTHYPKSWEKIVSSTDPNVTLLGISDDDNSKPVYSKNDMERYCSTAFFAGFANGSLTLPKAIEVLNQWVKDNIL